jgi:hypothetical protein
LGKTVASLRPFTPSRCCFRSLQSLSLSRSAPLSCSMCQDLLHQMNTEMQILASQVTLVETITWTRLLWTPPNLACCGRSNLITRKRLECTTGITATAISCLGNKINKLTQIPLIVLCETASVYSTIDWSANRIFGFFAKYHSHCECKNRPGASIEAACHSIPSV